MQERPLTRFFDFFFFCRNPWLIAPSYAKIRIMKQEKIKQRLNKKLSAQDRQDEVFRKMTADKKIKLSSELTLFCLKLNQLHGNNKSRKTPC